MVRVSPTDASGIGVAVGVAVAVAVGLGLGVAVGGRCAVKTGSGDGKATVGSRGAARVGDGSGDGDGWLAAASRDEISSAWSATVVFRAAMVVSRPLTSGLQATSTNASNGRIPIHEWVFVMFITLEKPTLVTPLQILTDGGLLVNVCA